jgi:hypothetical protein
MNFLGWAMTVRFWVLSTIALVSLSASGSAQTVLGEFKHWTAVANKEAKGKLCVAVAEPSKSAYSQPTKGRDQPMFFLSRFPSKDIQTEVSTILGYPIAANAKVVVQVDGTSTFTMFTEKDTAWLPDEEDAALVKAMREGDEMVVRGTSRRGTITTDTYSLAGVTAAVNAILKACP